MDRSGDCDHLTKDLFQGIVTPGLESSKELVLGIVIVALKRSTRDLSQGILTGIPGEKRGF